MARKLPAAQRTTTADRAQARRELEVARKREGILSAAARAFARGGYHATTMQDIAREAGYTPPSLYAYFEGGKEQIFVELAALLSREFMAVFEQPVAPGLPFAERLELLLLKLFEQADRYRDAVAVFLVASLSGEAMLSKGMTSASSHGADFSSVQLLTSWLRKNAKRDELGDQRPEVLGLALAGLTHAFCVAWLSEPSGTSSESSIASIVSLFLHGALGSGPPPKSARPRTR